MAAPFRTAAIFLLLACGLAALLVLLSRPPVQPVAALRQRREIPRLIHVTWREKDVLEWDDFSMVRLGPRALRDLNPEFRFRVYDDEEVRERLRATLSAQDWRSLQGRKFVTLCDIWRLVVMVEDGGVYSDIDRLWSAPLKDIMEESAECILPINGRWDFSQDVMIAVPGHEVHRRALRESLARLRAGRSVLDIGPQAYFDAICEELVGGAPPHRGTWPSDTTWKRIRTALSSAPHSTIQTFVEDLELGPTFGCRESPLPVADKAALYEASNVRPWGF